MSFHSTEADRKVKLLVEVSYYGKPGEDWKHAHEVAQKLGLAYGDNVVVFLPVHLSEEKPGDIRVWQAYRRYIFDPILDDGNPPPDYVPVEGANGADGAR